MLKCAPSQRHNRVWTIRNVDEVRMGPPFPANWRITSKCNKNQTENLIQRVFSGKFEYASVVNVQKRQIHKCTKNTNTKFVGGLILFYSAHCSSDIAPLLLLLLPSPLSFIQTLQNGLIGVPRTPCVFLWTEVGKKYRANTIQNNTPPLSTWWIWIYSCAKRFNCAFAKQQALCGSKKLAPPPPPTSAIVRYVSRSVSNQIKL